VAKVYTLTIKNRIAAIVIAIAILGLGAVFFTVGLALWPDWLWLEARLAPHTAWSEGFAAAPRPIAGRLAWLPTSSIPCSRFSRLARRLSGHPKMMQGE